MLYFPDEQYINLNRHFASTSTTAESGQPALLNAPAVSSFVLKNLSAYLSGLGLWGDALYVIEDAVELCRRPAAGYPTAFTSDLFIVSK